MSRRRSSSKKFRISPRLLFLLFFSFLIGFLILQRQNIAEWVGFTAKTAKPAEKSDKPKLVFVIDDIGYHLEEEKRMVQLGDKVTYAILPLLPYSRYFGNLGKKHNAEVILHLPLEAMDGTIPGRGLITRAMPRNMILDMVNRDLASVPNHSGINNHMGSLGTSDPELMKIIMAEVKKRGLFFLDSFTTPESTVVSTATELGVPVLRRDVFLDNIDAKKAIRDQIKKLKSVARKQGYAIGIGHYRTNTLEVLIQDIPDMEQEGFEIVSLQTVLDYVKNKKKVSDAA